MNGEKLIESLRRLKEYEIVFTRHAELRLAHRQVDRENVVNNIRRPDSLKLVEKLHSGKDEEKYKLWFVPFKRTAHVYVVVINHSQQRIIVKTVIKQRLVWQKRAGRHAR